MGFLAAAARLARRARPRPTGPGDPTDEIIVSRRYRFLYCPIPKAANSSFKAWIRKIEGQADYTSHLHDPARNGLTRLADLPRAERQRLLADPTWLRFVVVRDPFARLYSAYIDKLAPRADGRIEMPALAAKLRAKHDARFGPGLALPSGGRGSSGGGGSLPLSFAEFVRVVGTEDAVMMDPHWRPQALLAATDRVAYDVVIRLENLAAGAEALAARVGAPEPMTLHRHRRTPPGLTLAGVYDAETTATVRRVYAADFAAFGYPAELEAGGEGDAARA